MPVSDICSAANWSLFDCPRRGAGGSLNGALWNIGLAAVSLRLDAGELDHLAPLLCFGRNMLSELGWRTGKHDGAQVGKLLLDFWVGERGIDLSVELVDDFGRRAFG